MSIQTHMRIVSGMEPDGVECMQSVQAIDVAVLGVGWLPIRV